MILPVHTAIVGNRTVHLATFHLMLSYFEAVYCHRRVWTWVRVIVMFGLEFKLGARLGLEFRSGPECKLGAGLVFLKGFGRVRMK